MTSEIWSWLASICLILTQSTASYAIKPCSADSFYNRATESCEECTQFCPIDTVRTRECLPDADIVCSPSMPTPRAGPSTCASDWFLDVTTGRCRECTKHCDPPLAIVTPCRRDADAVCEESWPRRTTPLSALPSERITAKAAVAGTGQPTTTALAKPTPSRPVRPPEYPTPQSDFVGDEATAFPSSVGPPETSATAQSEAALIRTSPAPGSTDDSMNPPDEQTNNDQNFYLWIVIGVPVGIVLLVAAALLVCCCLTLRCECATKKDEETGVAGSGRMWRSRDSSQVEVGSSMYAQHAGPTLLPPPPGFRSNSASSVLSSLGSGSSLALPARTEAASTCGAESTEDGAYTAHHPVNTALGHGRVFGGRTPSLSNMFPPVTTRSLAAHSRVLLEADGTCRTQLASCACAEPNYCRCGWEPVAVCHRVNCSNPFLMSRVSLVSDEGTEYTV
ncbi:proline-rich receptor-like protein kinase PERK2 [Acanthaster planci]|uniref:Proline-rich receptor-like protein kinase PERK2 n=1 Tax=Acanthaster planci TaxID=133434 RepID=A0A8B7XQ64_ACAPL|nr:proline-rich receptor-like protein kinase PERK2 [Acanthaster planci]